MQYSADIKANGVLVVDGAAAMLTVKKTTKDKNGTSTETIDAELQDRRRAVPDQPVDR